MTQNKKHLVNSRRIRRLRIAWLSGGV